MPWIDDVAQDDDSRPVWRGDGACLLDDVVIFTLEIA
jgi:hypothetical protein